MKTLLVISTLILATYCNDIKAQGMPIDSKTKKVTYSETVQAPNQSKDLLLKKAATFLSSYTQFCGTVNAIYVDSEQSAVQCLLNISISEQIKMSINYVNASVRLVFSDNSYSYTITNLHVYTIVGASMYSEPIADINIEDSKFFNVNDFEKMNKNAKNTDKLIKQFTVDLRNYLSK